MWNKLTAILALAILLMPAGAVADPLFPSYPDYPSRGDALHHTDRALWWGKDLTFRALFNDPETPLWISKGTSILSVSRDSTGTYIHPRTGLRVTAPANTLRIESAGALVEGERSNLIQWSSQIDHAGWSLLAMKAFGAGSVADNAIGPDGTLSMDLLTEDATNTYHVAYQVRAVADLSHVTGSVYAKPKGRTWAILIINAAALKQAWFNLATGAVGSKDASVVSSGIEPGPNGTYRIWLTAVAESGGDSAAFYFGGAPGDGVSTFAGDNTSGMYFEGAQFEVGDSPSSLIPTVGATGTRKEDVLTVWPQMVADVAGTLVAEVTTRISGVPATILGTGGSVQPLGKYTTGNMFAYDGTNLLEGPAWGAGRHKVAVRWGAGKMNTAIDGTVGTQGNFDGHMDGAGNPYYIGSNAPGQNVFFGNIRSLMSFGRSFTDAEIAEITR
jgi:hypothetical protein